MKKGNKKKVTSKEIEEAYFKRVFKNHITDGRKGGYSYAFRHDIFKSSLQTIEGKKAKSYGAIIRYNKKIGKNEFRKIAGHIKETKLQQIQDFNINAVNYKGKALNLAQQMVDKAWRDRYNGQDIFSLIDAYGIKEYDVSAGWYIDPMTNIQHSLDDLVW